MDLENSESECMLMTVKKTAKGTLPCQGRPHTRCTQNQSKFFPFTGPFDSFIINEIEIALKRVLKFYSVDF